MNEIRVTKAYYNRITNEHKILNGTLRVDLTDEVAQELMNKSKISTIDPRIKWDEDFMEGDGWDYVDFSFAVVVEV